MPTALADTGATCMACCSPAAKGVGLPTTRLAGETPLEAIHTQARTASCGEGEGGPVPSVPSIPSLVEKTLSVCYTAVIWC